MDGEAGWWTTSWNIGLPPLARVMGVGRQHQAVKIALQLRMRGDVQLNLRSRGVVASAPDFERADEGSILTAGLCFKSGKSECNNSGYKLTGLTWWP